VEDEIDYTKHTESELVDMFGRMDPRYAQVECARLSKFLVERGFIVTDGGTGPGSAVPSPAKLQSLTGSDRPSEWAVEFGRSAGPFNWFEPTHNDFGFVGSGTLQTDGIHVYLSGRVRQRNFGASSSQQDVQLSLREIADVESQGRLVRFAYEVGKEDDVAITLRLADDAAAERLVAMLPTVRTEDFRPQQIKADAEFVTRLMAQSPKTPVTIGLVATNVLAFLATVYAGAEWFQTNGAAQIAWGSNFGPYTTEGEWWRLFTSLFIHFGIAHLLLNMFALAAFGPLIERLLGSVSYLIIYLLAGIAGSLASIAWHPDINSAGASGAIFGILGALLAVQLRAGATIPMDISHPIRYSTLTFLGWALYAGLTYKGIDSAAHLGGLACGFGLGLIAARPVTGERFSSRSDLRRVSQMVPVAALLLAGGFWYVQRASASMTGERLYWKTIHWLKQGEHATDAKYNTALALSKSHGQPIQLADSLKREVLPFWREAREQLAAINLEPSSPHLATLESLEDIVDAKVSGYEHFAEGIRKNDPEEIKVAIKTLKEIEETVKAGHGASQ
jgi:rhomboid protease GluP